MDYQPPPSWQTTNISITSALATLGFPWATPEAPCTNIYGKDDVIPMDRDGRPSRPGKVTFYMLPTSPSFPGVSLDDLLDEWRNGGTDTELDAYLSPAEGESDDVAEVKSTVRELLPLAVMSYMKGCLANRKQSAAAYRSAEPLRGWKDGNGAVIIHANASTEVGRKLEV